MLIKYVIGFLVVMGLSAWLIGSYLAPDDLKRCDDRPSTDSGCQAADAIIAVSGGDTLSRAREAIKLYHNGWADLIIFSGAAADPDSPSNAEVMRELALDSGISSAKIVIEEVSTTTAENASETSSILNSYNIQSAIVVTSGYHERRATMEFRHKNPNVDFRSHPSADDNQWGSLWWLTPRGWWLAFSELVKSIIVTFGGAV